MDISTLTLMFTGLSLGMLHAFDADHIMAVTSLSAKRSSPRQRVNLKYYPENLLLYLFLALCL